MDQLLQQKTTDRKLYFDGETIIWLSIWLSVALEMSSNDKIPNSQNWHSSFVLFVFLSFHRILRMVVQIRRQMQTKPSFM